MDAPARPSTPPPPQPGRGGRARCRRAQDRARSPGPSPSPASLPVLALLQGWCGDPEAAPIHPAHPPAAARARGRGGGPAHLRREGGGRWPGRHDALLAEPEGAPPAAPPRPPARRAAARRRARAPGRRRLRALPCDHPSLPRGPPLRRGASSCSRPPGSSWSPRTGSGGCATATRPSPSSRRTATGCGGELGAAVHAELRREDVPTLPRPRSPARRRRPGDGWEVALGLRAGAGRRGGDPRGGRGGPRLRRGAMEESSSSTPRASAGLPTRSGPSPDGGPAPPARAGTPSVSAPRAGRRRRGVAGAAFRPDSGRPEDWRARTAALRNLSRLEPAPVPRRPRGCPAPLPAARRRVALAPPPERPRRRAGRRDGPRQDPAGARAPVRRARPGAARASSSVRPRLSRIGGARRRASRRACASSSHRGACGCGEAGRLCGLGPRHHLLRDPCARPRPLRVGRVSRASSATRPST